MRDCCGKAEKNGGNDCYQRIDMATSLPLYHVTLVELFTLITLSFMSTHNELHTNRDYLPHKAYLPLR